MDTIDLRTQPSFEAIAGSLMSMIEAGQMNARALPVSASATVPPAGLVAQLAEARLMLARRLLAGNTQFMALDRAISDLEAALPAVPAGVRSHRKRPTQCDAAMTVLSQAEEPLTIKEILDRITQMGARVGGRRPLGTLASSLSQDSRFEAVRDGASRTWRLAVWQD
jgi:hypothetical protein